MAPEAQQLVNEMDADAKVAFQGGRANHRGDLICSIGAIVASFVATILVGIPNVPRWLTASVAALPGLCASLQRVIDFRGRAAWYFIKAAQFRDLSRNVKYETMPLQDAARRLGEIDKALEDRWPEFVKTGSPPPSRS